MFEQDVFLCNVAYIPSSCSFEGPDCHREDAFHVKELGFPTVISARAKQRGNAFKKWKKRVQAMFQTFANGDRLEKPSIVVGTSRATCSLCGGCSRVADASSNGLLPARRAATVRSGARGSLCFGLGCISVRVVGIAGVHIRC